MATVATKKKDKEKEKAEHRRQSDEIKSLAMRQGYITEDQILSSSRIPTPTSRSTTWMTSIPCWAA
jgi:hypothetical protein